MSVLGKNAQALKSYIISDLVGISTMYRGREQSPLIWRPPTWSPEQKACLRPADSVLSCHSLLAKVLSVVFDNIIFFGPDMMITETNRRYCSHNNCIMGSVATPGG